MCKPCKKVYNKTWYTANKEKHISNVKKNNQRYSKELRKIVDEKKAVPCADCKNSFPPECMDFDHLDPSMKIDDIARMVSTSTSVAKLQAEIDKCEVVCACCHRTRTKNRSASVPLEGESFS